jgi:hypothetical protein
VRLDFWHRCVSFAQKRMKRWVIKLLEMDLKCSIDLCVVGGTRCMRRFEVS